MTNPTEICERLLQGARDVDRDYAAVIASDMEEASELIEAQAKQIAELEARLHRTEQQPDDETTLALALKFGAEYEPDEIWMLRAFAYSMGAPWHPVCGSNVAGNEGTGAVDMIGEGE